MRNIKSDMNLSGVFCEKFGLYNKILHRKAQHYFLVLRLKNLGNNRCADNHYNTDKPP